MEGKITSNLVTITMAREREIMKETGLRRYCPMPIEPCTKRTIGQTYIGRLQWCHRLRPLVGQVAQRHQSSLLVQMKKGLK
jgi:hypothetical protein